jgi:hypothetical protein
MILECLLERVGGERKPVFEKAIFLPRQGAIVPKFPMSGFVRSAEEFGNKNDDLVSMAILERQDLHQAVSSPESAPVVLVVFLRLRDGALRRSQGFFDLWMHEKEKGCSSKGKTQRTLQSAFPLSGCFKASPISHGFHVCSLQVLPLLSITNKNQ